MKQLFLILIVIALAVTGASWLKSNKPAIKKRTKKPSIPVVKVIPLKQQNYDIVIHSSGVVEAQTQTNLVTEVAGKITKIGKAFQEGNYLKKNDFLLKINETDYLNHINIAKAEIAQQQLGLQEQLVQRKLAKQDWNLFGEKKKKPSQLALRTPHIASAKAGLEAAKIRMEQAQIQLSRTTIRAPYEGRVLQRSVDIGQYVTPGTILGKIFATNSIEVRLPLSLADYEQLAIPEHYQGESKPNTTNLPKVTFYTDNADKEKHQWQGQIVRTSASLDSNTRQISVIARINKPFSRSETGTPTIKLGQFLQADIVGKQLNNIAIIPASAVREQKEILLFVEGKIKIQAITILHTDNHNIIIASDAISDNSELILTPPPFANDGMKVKRFSENKTITKDNDKKDEGNEDNEDNKKASNKPEDNEKKKH